MNLRCKRAARTAPEGMACGQAGNQARFGKARHRRFGKNCICWLAAARQEGEGDSHTACANCSGEMRQKNRPNVNATSATPCAKRRIAQPFSRRGLHALPVKARRGAIFFSSGSRQFNIFHQRLIGKPSGCIGMHRRAQTWLDRPVAMPRPVASADSSWLAPDFKRPVYGSIQLHIESPPSALAFKACQNQIQGHRWEAVVSACKKQQGIGLGC